MNTCNNKELTNLKRQKTRLLKVEPKTMEQFEKVQAKLNEVEVKMIIAKKG